MPEVIYDVAVTLDGYICGPDEDISRFPADDDLVADYRARLAGYRSAIMGRRTYLFGTRYGMALGENPYPHMRTLVFSSSLALPSERAVELVPVTGDAALAAQVAALDGPVYLCGGGVFAGAALRLGLIDRIVVKRAPVVLGAGTPLFAGGTPAALRLTGRRSYPGGAVLEVYGLTG